MKKKIPVFLELLAAVLITWAAASKLWRDNPNNVFFTSRLSQSKEQKLKSQMVLMHTYPWTLISISLSESLLIIEFRIAISHACEVLITPHTSLTSRNLLFTYSFISKVSELDWPMLVVLKNVSLLLLLLPLIKNLCVQPQASPLLCSFGSPPYTWQGLWSFYSCTGHKGRLLTPFMRKKPMKTRFYYEEKPGYYIETMEYFFHIQFKQS